MSKKKGAAVAMVKDVAKGKQKPKTKAGKDRSEKQRRTGQPVTTSNPLFTNMSNPANSNPGKVDVLHKVSINAESFNTVVSTFVQQVKVYMNDSIELNNNDYFTLYVTIFEDLKRAMLGSISIFDEAPLIYRELFEAITPSSAVVDGQITQRYFFDPDQVKALLPIPPAGVYWGQPLSADATEMVLLENPANASENVPIASQMFQVFKSQGAAWWVKSRSRETVYLHDTSAYAYPSDFDNQPLKNTNWQASLETPIRYLWVAGLRLVNFFEKQNRQLNHHVTMYAGPQTHFGYRLSSQLNGNEEQYTQVRVKMLDMTELTYLSKAQVLGVQQKFGASTTTNDTASGAPDSETVPFYEGDSVAFRVAVAGIVAVSQFRESASISGYQSNLIGFVPFNFANQFYNKSKNQENIELFFRLIVENLRRLKCISTLEKGNKFVTFNVFGSSPNIAEAESTEYPWTQDLFSATGLSPLTFVTTNGPVCINNTGKDDDLVGRFPHYITQLLIYMTRAQSFVKFAAANSQREMSSQQLTHFTRYVDTPSGEEIPPPEQQMRRSEVQTRYVKSANRVLNSLERSQFKKLNFPRAAQTVRISDVLVGVYYGLGNKSPSKYRQELLLALVLPLWPADAPLVGNTDRVVACSTRMGDFGQSPTNTEEQSYYRPYVLTGIQNTYPRGADTEPTELMNAFDTNADLGLGGNLSDKFRIALRVGSAAMDGGRCALDSYKHSGMKVK